MRRRVVFSQTEVKCSCRSIIIRFGTSNEAEYKFSNNDDGTYTMWVDGGGKEGYYKIYNMCEDGGSKCWIQFDCLKNDKEYSDDC